MIETRQLSKQYGRVAALRQLDLAIPSAEIFGLLGPNGSGKTTALRLLMGLLRPTFGSASIAGFDCWRQGLALRDRVGYLPGELRLYPNLSGHQTVRFFAKLRRADCLARARQVADQLELDLDKRVAAMSTGMRQKLGLVIVLALPADVLILDEPTSGLDPTARLQFLQLVSEAQAEGRTVVLSSHVISEIEQVCHRVAILRAGSLVAENRLASLRDSRRIVIQFEGTAPRPPEALPAVSNVRVTGAEVALTLRGPMGPVLRWLDGLAVRDLQIEPGGLLALYRHHHGKEPAA